MSSEKYKPDASGTTFSMLTAILGVLYLIGQFVVPFVAMVFSMPMMPMAGGEISMIDVDQAVLHDDRIWYIANKHKFKKQEDDEPPGTSVLYRFTPGSKDEEPEKITSLDMQHPRLVSTGNTLWLVSSSSVAEVQDESVVNSVDTKERGHFNQLFTKDGKLAMLDDRPEKKRILAFDGKTWTVVEELPITSSEQDDGCCLQFKIAHAGDTYYFFRRYKNTLYYRTGIPEVPLNLVDDWEPVVKHLGMWHVTSTGDRPMVFFNQRGDGFYSTIKGLTFTGEKWTETVSISGQQAVTGFRVMPTSDPKTYFVMTEGFPGQASVSTVEDGTTVNEYTIGESFMGEMMSSMMLVMQGSMIVGPLILALILSFLMATYRIQEYVHEGIRRTFAPLWKRAVAQLIDLLILGAPHFILTYYLFSRFFSGGFPVPGLWMVLPMCGGVFWWVLFGFLFAYMEGSMGQTPGKMITGIKVLGVDLEPCGFGRSLLRNILKIADAVFNGLIGLLFVALTTNWQRVGDLAAETIVVTTGKNGDHLVEHERDQIEGEHQPEPGKGLDETTL